MIKKTLTYEDYDGNERTEDFYFHLSKNEIVKWEVSREGGLYAYIEKLIKSGTPKQFVDFIDEVIDRAYGEKSDDGRKFRKSLELASEFKATPAYDALFMSFLDDNDDAAEEASKFVNGLFPKDIQKEVEKEAKKERKKLESKKDA